MGWFSPVKGPYPSLAQVDKTLPAADSVTTFERGMIVAVTSDATGANAEFKIAGNTDSILYVALQDSSDPTAGFVGTAFDPQGGKPAIGALDLTQDGEYETSVYDKTKTNYTVGAKLYVADGLLTTTGSDGTNPLVGYVTAAPFERWVNDAVAVPGSPNDRRLAVRTGANVSVIRFKTAI